MGDPARFQLERMRKIVDEARIFSQLNGITGSGLALHHLRLCGQLVRSVD